MHASWKPSATPSSPTSHILPHTPQAGDPYYIGDVYEPSRIGQSGELIEGQHLAYKTPAPTSKPYLRYLESLAQGWPHISYFADFMKVTTSPTKQRFLTEEDKKERASRTKVAMLAFEPDGQAHRVDFTNSKDLYHALDKAKDCPDDTHARLIVVEDLSRDVIETLGSCFDVDPHFFRGHISDYIWYNTRDPWVELPTPDIIARKSSYMHVRYVQTRYFRSEASVKRAKYEVGGFNVLRRLDRDGNWLPNVDIPDSDVGLIRTRASLWIRPNKTEESGILGILLVDPTIKEGHPIWGGHDNLRECPSMTEVPTPGGPPRSSILEDVIHYTCTLTSEEIMNIAKDPRILLKKTLLVVCAEWYTLTKYAATRVSQLEWEAEKADLQDDKGGLQVTIQKLHTWRRRLPIYRTLIAEVLETIIGREQFMGSSENHVLDLQRDFEIVLKNVEDLQVRADRTMAVVTAVMSIEESRKAVEQNRSLTRLTWLAVIFVPLSFTTSLFSMNSDLSSLSGTLRVFFAVAIPLTALVLFLTRFASVGLDVEWKGLFRKMTVRKSQPAEKWN